MEINSNIKLITDTIVPVKILKREGNTLDININGIIIKATNKSNNIPESFLGLIEKSENSYNIKILNTFKNDKEYLNWVNNKIIEQIKEYFLQNNIPLDKNYLISAFILYKYGITLNRDNIKLIHKNMLKYGIEFVENILKNKGIELLKEEEIIDLLNNYGSKILRICQFENSNQENNENDNFYHTILFYNNVFQDNKIVDIKLIEIKNILYCFIFKKINSSENNKYIVEVYDENSKKFFLEITKINEKYHIKSYLEEKLINRKNFKDQAENFIKRIKSKIKNIDFEIEFLSESEFKNTDKEEDNKRIINIDIKI